MVIIHELERPLGASALAWEFREIPGLTLVLGPRDIPLFQYSDGKPGPGWKFENWGDSFLASQIMDHLAEGNFATRSSAMNSLDLVLSKLGYA